MAPLHVGLNLIYLVPGETGGMEVVARELIPALAASGRVRLTAFVNREAAEAGGAPGCERIEQVTVPVRARNRVEWVRGEQQLLPRLAARAGVDLVHSLASTAPAWGRFVRVVTIHDLIFWRYPEAHAGLRTRGMKVLVPLAARRSHRILADSASTRDDLIRHLRTPAERIDVVPLGVGATPSVEPLPESEVRRRHDLGARRMVLSVSAKRPHKNLLGLLDAWALIPGEDRPILVIPGYPTWHEAELGERAAVLGLSDDVRLPGWVDDAELEGLYAAAAGFVFPSFYEGFGMTVLEAMRRGVPVACSDRSSLPEVAGDAALTFDPERPADIAAAVRSLLGDPVRAQRLRAAGRARAARFTWEATAGAVLDSYDRAVAASRSVPR